MVQSSIKKKLTIIHSTSIWLPQTMTWLYNQVRSLPEEIESHIVCEVTQNIDQFSLPNIHCLSNAGKWRYYWDYMMRKFHLRRHLGFQVYIAKQKHADIVHSHFGNQGWLDLGVAKKAGLKHIVTFYGLDVNYLPQLDSRWYERYSELFKQVDRVLCEGPYMAQCVFDLGCPEQKVRVHHLGVNVDEIPFRPRVFSPGEHLRILIAALFREKKGIPYALEALGRLQHEIPIEITLIGDASREPRSQAEKQKILATIEKYKLKDKIRMLGYQPHTILLEEAYRHHVFLSPSVTTSDGDTEGGAPVTIIEMLATGMPVVSTKHCDIPGIIKHGITGLLAEERDVDGLVRHLKWLIDHPEQWHDMVRAGRMHVEAEFNARVQGERLAAIYKELIVEKL